MSATKNQDVIVLLTREVSGGKATWQMDIANQGNGGPNNYPPAKVNFGSSADFHFIISGKGTKNIKFDAVNPISVSLDNGTGLSPTASGNKTDQIVDVSPGGGKVLTFTDLNENPPTKGDPPVKLVYQLNFTGAEPLDPIVENGGGGGNRFDPTSLYAGVAIAGLILAVAFFFIGRAFQRKHK